MQCTLQDEGQAMFAFLIEQNGRADLMYLQPKEPYRLIFQVLESRQISLNPSSGSMLFVREKFA